MTPGDGCCCIGVHNDRLSAYCLWLAVKCPAWGEMREIRGKRGGSGRGWYWLVASQAGVNSSDVETSPLSTGVLLSEVVAVDRKSVV